MFPGMNSRQAQQMMRKMGINQKEIEAAEVIIKLSDKQLVFSSPQVSHMNMMGQEMYQVVGEPEEVLYESASSITDEDIQTVMQQAEVSEEEAREAIESANGDLADAIMKLQQ